MSTQDYSNYSYDELLDIYQNIDREAFPEKFNEVQKLISEKEADGEVKEYFIENANWLPKLISAIQIISGVWGVFGIYDFLSPYALEQIDFYYRTLYGTLCIYFLLSIFAGFYLFQNKRFGYLSSIVIQALQVISFSISKISYSISSLFLLEVSVAEGGILGARFNLNTVGFNISYIPDGLSFMFAVNMTALFFVYVLMIHYEKCTTISR